MNKLIWVVVILVVLVGAYAVFTKQGSQQTDQQANVLTSTTTTTPTTTPTPVSAPTPSPADQSANTNPLKQEDLTVGKGAQAKTGDKVTVQYVGTLENGTKFDSSYDHGKPFEFTLGKGEVIKGWDTGVLGMKVGGKRRLTIAPLLAYGANGFPPIIPANATLTFDIELVTVNGHK